MQDEEIILSHQDAVMDHGPLQSYGQNLHPNLPEQLLIHNFTFNPADINLDSLCRTACIENSIELTKSLQIILLIIRLDTHAQYVSDYGF